MKNSTTNFTVLLLFLVSIRANSQANLSGYVNEEIFTVKPVITASNFKDDNNGFDFFKSDIEKGVSLMSSGNLDDALHYFKDLGLEYNGVPEIPFYQGLIYFQKENFQDARDAFQNVLRISPLFLTPYYYIGLIEIEEGNLSLAKENMDRLTAIEAYSAIGFYGHAQIATKELNSQKAKRMYQKCLEMDSLFQEAYIPLALIELSINPYARVSRRLMDSAVKRFPDWEEGLITRSILTVIENQNDLSQFETDINKLISLNPKNYHYFSFKGYLNVELNQYKSAILDFKRAFDLSLTNIDKGEFKFSTRFERSIKIKDAIDYYFKYKYSFNPSVEHLIDKGICHIIIEDVQTASHCFDSALLIQKHSVLSFLKAVIYDISNKQKEAIEFYSKAILEDSLNTGAYLRKANLYVESGEYDLALIDYNRMIKLGMRSKESYKKRGIVHIQLANYQRGYLDMTYAIMLDSTDSDLFYNRALAATEMKHFNQAVKDLKQVLSKKPEDSDAHYLLSLNFLNLNDTLKAISYLDSASLYGKYKKDYHLQLVDFCLNIKMYDKVAEGYARLIKYFSNERRHLYNRGLFFYKLGKFDLAAKDFEELLKYSKNDAVTSYYYGKTLIMLGNEQEGLKYIEKSIKSGFNAPE